MYREKQQFVIYLTAKMLKTASNEQKLNYEVLQLFLFKSVYIRAVQKTLFSQKITSKRFFVAPVAK